METKKKEILRSYRNNVNWLYMTGRLCASDKYETGRCREQSLDSHEFVVNFADKVPFCVSRLGHALYFQMTPLLGVLVGAAATLLLIVLTVAIVVHRRNHLKRRQQRQLNNQSAEQRAPNQSGSNGPNQPLLPLPHALPNSNPTGTGNAICNGGGTDSEGHHRAVLLNKNSASNGHHPTHFNKLNSPSKSATSSSTSQQYHQQEPDIILRDMGKVLEWIWWTRQPPFQFASLLLVVDFQPKRMLPAVMQMNNPPATGTLSRRGLKTNFEDEDAESLQFRQELTSRSQQQQSPLSLSNRSSKSASWNTGISHGGNNHWPAPGHQSPSLGLFTHNGTLMHQHNTAADLLADCRLPESSLWEWENIRGRLTYCTYSGGGCGALARTCQSVPNG